MDALKRKKTVADIMKDVTYCILIAATWVGMLTMFIIF